MILDLPWHLEGCQFPRPHALAMVLFNTEKKRIDKCLWVLIWPKYMVQGSWHNLGSV